MNGFWVGAAVLAAAALALLYRPKRGLLALSLAVLAIGAALLVYRAVDNWQPVAQSEAERQARAEIAALQKAARDNPADGSGWLKLGQKYLQYEQYPLAVNALRTSHRVYGGNHAGAAAALAEAMALDGDESNDAQVAPLFESVLRVEPRNAKALFYTGLKALRDNALPLARERFGAMLGPDVPAEVQAALQKQIAAIDRQLAEAPAPTPAGAAAASVLVRVEVLPALRASAAARTAGGARLFVFVRNPDGGPPLAVKRISGALPVQTELSSADAMMAGNGIRPGMRLQIVARLSTSGAPTATSGDLEGDAFASAGGGTPVVVTLARTVP